MNIGKEIIEYVCKLTYDDLPNDVIHQAKRTVLDAVASILLGSKEQEAQKILEFIGKLESGGNATILGSKTTCSWLWAAFANACFAQIHDCNDGHRAAAAFGGEPHPGRSVIPTALAVGEKLSSSGEDIITAIVIGYDVATRIRRLDKKATAAAYASAAVAGKLMDLNETEMFNAIGIAGYGSPVTSVDLMTRMTYDTNFISNGYIAKTGIEAALLAKEGLTGPPIEDDSRLSTRFKDRGLWSEFEIMNIYFKPYPTCRMTHGAIQAILDLKAEIGFDPSDIEEVKIHQVTQGMYVAKKQIDITSPYKLCEFNLPYISACAIIDGEIGMEQFAKDRISDPSIHEMIKQIKVISDEEMDTAYPEKNRPTLIEVKLKNGCLYKKKVELAKGDAVTPFTDNELFCKFKDWTASYLSEELADKIKEVVFNMDKIESITELFTLFK